MTQEYKYPFIDESLKCDYADILENHNKSLNQSTDYQAEIALATVQINYFTKTPVEELRELEFLRWRQINEAIRLKSLLIREERLEKDRREKLELRKQMANSIPKGDVEVMLMEIVRQLSSELSSEQFSKISAFCSSWLAVLREGVSKLV